MKVKIIAAIGKNRELGNKGGLPEWNLPTDLKRFKELTSGSVVVMGRKNFESLPEKFRPLPNRTNVVLTRDTSWSQEGVLVMHSVEEILEKYRNENSLWIIGGAEIYKQFLEVANELHITHVDGEFEADTIFPEFLHLNLKEEEVEQIKKDEKNSHPSVYKIYRK